MVRILTNLLDVLGVAGIGLIAAAGASGYLGEAETVFLGYTLSFDSPNSIFLVMLLVTGLFASKAVISVFLLKALLLFLARVEVEAATSMARYLFTAGLQRMREFSKSEIQWATTTSTSVAVSGILGSIGILVTETGLLLMMVVFFFVVDPLAAAGVTAYFAIVVIAFQLAINNRLRRSGRKTAVGSVGVTQSALDLFDGFREISVLGKQDFFLERFRESRNTQASGDATLRYLNNIPRYFIETALVFGALAFVGWQLLRGELADGLVAVGVFLTGGVRVMAALLPLQTAFSGLKSQAEQAKLSQEILMLSRRDGSIERSSFEEKRTSDAIRRSFQTALSVDLEGTSFRYPDANVFALKDMNLNIKAGSYVALVGPSGAGKTTLADLILGLHQPNSGSVRLGGLDAFVLRSQYPGLISYVPQKPGLVSGTIGQNVALGLPDSEIDRSRVWEVLKRAELSEMVENLPEGIDSLVGKHSEALSGGQIQRLGLARALYSNPRLIVLDEATSALDAQTEATVSQSILNLKGECTVIVIAHRLSTVQRADTVFVLEAGEIVDSGSFRNLRKRVPLIENYVRLMSFDEE